MRSETIDAFFMNKIGRKCEHVFSNKNKYFKIVTNFLPKENKSPLPISKKVGYNG